MNYKKEPLNGHEEYSVDTEGNVYGKNGEPLKYNVNKSGYRYVVLCENGKCKTVSVHRIVACQFLKGDCLRRIVNHIDGDRENNRVENLEWVTAQENSRHAVDVLGSFKGKNNAASKPVVGVGKKTNVVEYRFDSLGEAARYFAEKYGKRDVYIKQAIWCAVKGRKKSYRGCEWRYESVD